MSFRLDPFNRRVLDLTRDRDFDRGIREIPRDELAALVDLYRQAPLRRRERSRHRHPDRLPAHAGR